MKPSLDMGRLGTKAPKQAGERQGKAGATFDPKNFKGNVQLFRHLADISVSMCRQKFESTDAIK
jgi:hypothetical protein